MSIFVFKRCPACEWRSGTYGGGPSGRMMGVNTAGNQAEDEYDEHFRTAHPFKPRRRAASGSRPDEEGTDNG